MENLQPLRSFLFLFPSRSHFRFRLFSFLFLCFVLYFVFPSFFLQGTRWISIRKFPRHGSAVSIPRDLGFNLRAMQRRNLPRNDKKSNFRRLLGNADCVSLLTETAAPSLECTPDWKLPLFDQGVYEPLRSAGTCSLLRCAGHARVTPPDFAPPFSVIIFETTLSQWHENFYI